MNCRNNKFVHIQAEIISAEDLDPMPYDKNTSGNPVPLCCFINQYFVYLLNGSMYFTNSSGTFRPTKHFRSVSWLIKYGRNLDKKRLWFTSNVRRILHEIDLIWNTSVPIIDFKELLCCVIFQPCAFKKSGNFHFLNAIC